MCNHRYRVGRWVHPGIWTNDPKAMAWDVGHPGDFGHMTPAAESGRCGLPGDCVLISSGTGSGMEESTWGLWTCDPKCSVWEEADPGDCGSVIPCIWSWGSPWILQTLKSRYSVCVGCHHGECGHVTLGTRSGRG